ADAQLGELCIPRRTLVYHAYRSYSTNHLHERLRKSSPFRKFHPERGSCEMSENRGITLCNARHPARALRAQVVKVCSENGKSSHFWKQELNPRPNFCHLFAPVYTQYQ